MILLIPTHEDIIKCSNSKENIYFCKGHCTNENFSNKLKTKIELQHLTIKQCHGELYINPLRGLVFKTLDNSNKNSFPVTFVKVDKLER